MRLEDYAALAYGLPCATCGEPLKDALENVDHKEGWLVEEFGDKRQWLYVTCQVESCRYKNSLWKLGIPGLKNPGPNKLACVEARNKCLARYVKLQFPVNGLGNCVEARIVPSMSSRDSHRAEQMFHEGWRYLRQLEEEHSPFNPVQYLLVGRRP